MPPELRDLIGDDLPPEERERLRRVHDLLVTAGPPPDLPPALAQPPRSAARAGFLPRRRRGAFLLLAAALAAIAFGVGYLAGERDGGFEVVRTVAMQGTAGQAAARASIQIGERDEGGNWPMILRVRGLKELGPGGYYELLLTREGEPVAPCGTFRVHEGTTTVQLSAPYKLSEFDGWVVAAHPRGHVQNPPIVMST